MTNTWVVLLRGINVNPTTRLAMADLRSILEADGLQNVRTILQSGNILADAPSRPNAAKLSAVITAKSGVKTSAIALSQKEFVAISDGNPLRNDQSISSREDLSKMVITFLDGDIEPREIERLSDDELEPERLVLRRRAIYQWCPDGILKSKLSPSFWRQLGPVATSRNARTVDRIVAALG